MVSTCTAKIHSHHSVKASDHLPIGSRFTEALVQKQRRFLPVATRVTVTGGDSSAPSGRRRVPNLALTDPLSRKLAAPLG